MNWQVVREVTTVSSKATPPVSSRTSRCLVRSSEVRSAPPGWKVVPGWMFQRSPAPIFR